MRFGIHICLGSKVLIFTVCTCFEHKQCCDQQQYEVSVLPSQMVKMPWQETHMRKLRQLFSKFNSETGSDEPDAIITFPMFEARRVHSCRGSFVLMS